MDKKSNTHAPSGMKTKNTELFVSTVRMTSPKEHSWVYADSGACHSLPNRTVPERRRCETSETATCSVLIKDN